MAQSAGHMSRCPPRGAARLGARAVLRLVAALGIGLMLGACSKCDVPAWQHSSTGGVPAVCHDSPAPQ